MSVIILVLQVIIIVGGYFVVEYIKKVPDQIHKKNLETFKNELRKEIIKLEASESNLHLKKIEKFTEFTSIMQETISSVKYEPDEKEELEKKITKSMETFTKDLIFFAGEDTLDKFVEYRRYSQFVQDGGINEKAKFQFILAELILEMRKDLGFDNDGINADHYLYILINNWDANKELFRDRASKAKQLS